MAKAFDAAAAATLDELIKNNSKIHWRPKVRAKKSRVVSYQFSFPKSLADKALVEVVVSFGNKKVMRKKERIWFGLSFIKREKYREQEAPDEKAEQERLLSLRQFVAEASGDRADNRKPEGGKGGDKRVSPNGNGEAGSKAAGLPMGKKRVQGKPKRKPSWLTANYTTPAKAKTKKKVAVKEGGASHGKAKG